MSVVFRPEELLNNTKLAREASVCKIARLQAQIDEGNSQIHALRQKMGDVGAPLLQRPSPVTSPEHTVSQGVGSSLSRGYASPALKALHERILAEKRSTGPTIQPHPRVAQDHVLPAPGATQEAQAVQLQCAREIDVLVASLMETENMLRRERETHDSIATRLEHLEKHVTTEGLLGQEAQGPLNSTSSGVDQSPSEASRAGITAMERARLAVNKLQDDVVARAPLAQLYTRTPAPEQPLQPPPPPQQPPCPEHQLEEAGVLNEPKWVAMAPDPTTAQAHRAAQAAIAMISNQTASNDTQRAAQAAVEAVASRELHLQPDDAYSDHKQGKSTSSTTATEAKTATETKTATEAKTVTHSSEYRALQDELHQPPPLVEATRSRTTPDKARSPEQLYSPSADELNQMSEVNPTAK